MIEIKKANSNAIRYACLHYHYAKAVPSVSYGYNIYENGEWCGTICFGNGATPNIGTEFGMIQGEILELVRVALNGKQTTTSECVAGTLRQLHRDAPEVKMIVSYADIDQNHFGTIYQATNWIYTGERNVGQKGFYIIHGKKVHPKTCHNHGWTQNLEWIRQHVDPNAQEIKTKGKRKYIYIFDRKTRKRLKGLSKPYPKKDEHDNMEGNN